MPVVTPSRGLDTHRKGRLPLARGVLSAIIGRSSVSTALASWQDKIQPAPMPSPLKLIAFASAKVGRAMTKSAFVLAVFMDPPEYYISPAHSRQYMSSMGKVAR